MLGRLGMTVEQALQKYSELTKDIFYRKQPLWRDGAYKADRLSRAVCEAVEEHGSTKSKDETLVTQDDRCKVFVCATPARNILVGRPRRLRSYHVRSNPGYEGIKIWEAARATSAAPTFFKAIKIGPDEARKEEFIDAAVGCNNPVKQLLDEAQSVFPANLPVACVVSIGTGIPHVTDLEKPTILTKILPLNVIKALSEVATESQSASNGIKARFDNVPGFYFRLNVDQGLQDVEMDEWERRNDVITHTREYLIQNTKMIDEVVVAILNRPDRLPLSSLGGQIAPQSLNIRRPVPLAHPLFIGREEILGKMGHFLFGDNAALSRASGSAIVLYGLGEMGKSQTAFEFVQRHVGRLDETFFVDASDKESLELSMKLLLPDNLSDASAAQAKAWLESKDHPWLILFDNANQTLILANTSRNKEMCVHAPYCNFEVLELGEGEACDLLLSAAMLHVTDKTNRSLAGPIASALGNLPLALMQAGSYISTHGRLSTYLDLYNAKYTLLWSRGRNQTADGYKHTVSTVWIISIEALSPATREFIQLCSCFNNVDIGEDIFRRSVDSWGAFHKATSTASTEFSNLNSAQPPLLQLQLKKRILADPLYEETRVFVCSFQDGNEFWDSFFFEGIMGDIACQSMARFGNSGAFTFHPIVHQWTWESLSQAQRKRLLGLATGIFLPACLALGSDSMPLSFAYTLVPHLQHLITLFERHSGDVPIYFTQSIRYLLVVCGEWRLKYRLDHLSLDLLQNEAKSNHFHMAWSCSLAVSAHMLGLQSEAESLRRDVLNTIGQTKELGINSMDQLSILSNLTLILTSQDQSKHVNEGQWKFFKATIDAAGPENLLHVAGEDLGLTMSRIGEKLRSEALLLALFRIRHESYLHGFYPEMDLLISAAHLAKVYHSLRKDISAGLFRCIIRGYERLASLDHIFCLEAMVELAELKLGSGEYEVSKMLLLRVIRHARRNSLETTPQNLNARKLLTFARTGVGEIGRAIQELKGIIPNLPCPGFKTEFLRLGELFALLLRKHGNIEGSYNVLEQAIRNFDPGEQDSDIQQLKEAVEQVRILDPSGHAKVVDDRSLRNDHDEEKQAIEFTDAYFYEDPKDITNLTYEDLLATCLELRPDVSQLWDDASGDMKIFCLSLYHYVHETTEEEMAESLGYSKKDRDNVQGAFELSEVSSDLQSE